MEGIEVVNMDDEEEKVTNYEEDTGNDCLK